MSARATTRSGGTRIDSQTGLEADPAGALDGRPGTALRVDVCDDAGTLTRIEPAWRELICPADRSKAFMRPEWIRAWWAAFGRAGQLRLMTVWQGDRLVGVLPLMLHAVRRYGIGLRRLGAVANVHSPRFDLMVAPGVEGVVDAVWNRIAGMEEQWDVFELPRLLSTSPSIRTLSERARSDGFRFGLWQAESSPFIDTDTEWDAYLAARSKNLRKEVRRKLRQMAQIGRTTLEIVDEPAAVPEALDAGFNIEADGWKGRNGSAMRSLADVRRFYRELAVRMADSGLLRMHFLKLDGEPVAFDLSIELERRLFSLKSGFRQALSARSPGLVLLGLMLEHYMSSDLEEIDLLGGEDPFKRRWTQRSRSHHWFVCFARTPRGHAVHRIKFGMMPRLRKLSGRLGAAGQALR